MKTIQQYKTDNPHLNADQIASGYQLSQIEGFAQEPADGLLFSNGTLTLRMEPNGNARAIRGSAITIADSFNHTDNQ